MVSVRKAVAAVAAWVRAEREALDPEARAALSLARLCGLLIVLVTAGLIAGNLSIGYRGLMHLHVGTCAAILANVFAYPLHRRPGILVNGLGAIQLASTTAAVAITENLAAALPWWGLLPVAAALLVRTRRGVCVWTIVTLLTLGLHVHLSDPARFTLGKPLVTVATVVLAYGGLGLAYVGSHERIRAQADAAEATVRELHKLLPICAYCKKIRDDEGYWHQVEAYLVEHTSAELTHSICPACLEQVHLEIDRLAEGR